MVLIIKINNNNNKKLFKLVLYYWIKITNTFFVVFYRIKIQSELEDEK